MKAKENTYYAFIYDGVVREIYPPGEVTEWNEDDVLIVECNPRETFIGQRFVDSKFILKTLDEEKESKLLTLKNIFEVANEELEKEHYPYAETQTFALQYEEAKAYLENGTKPSLISLLAEQREQDLDTFSKKIIEVRERQNRKSFPLFVHYKGLERKIKNARNIEELDLIEPKDLIDKPLVVFNEEKEQTQEQEAEEEIKEEEKKTKKTKEVK